MKKTFPHTSACVHGIGRVARASVIDGACVGPLANSMNRVGPLLCHQRHQAEKRLIVPNHPRVLFSHGRSRGSEPRSFQFAIVQHGRDAALKGKTSRR